jgi:hypothetical protein
MRFLAGIGAVLLFGLMLWNIFTDKSNYRELPLVVLLDVLLVTLLSSAGAVLLMLYGLSG